jgi:8-oxo-dGTP pyrophosphatase MutT (NUDIX family)
MVYNNTNNTWPKAFCSYKPRSQKVYGAICKNTDKNYLLVQGRKTGKWSWPKGHIQLGENVYDCVKREVYEETGIQSLPSPESSIRLKAGEYFLYDFTDNYPDLIPIDKDEIMNIGWFSLDQIRLNRNNCNIDVNFFARQQ